MSVVFWIRLISCLPLAFTTRLFYALGWLSSFLPLRWHSAYRAIYVNLLICYPDKTPAELRREARRTLGELCWTLIDCAHSWTHDAATNIARIKQVHGHDALKSAMASDRPVLLLSLHQSSWELPNLTVGQLGATTVFYQPADDPKLTALVTQAREGTGSKLVPANARGTKAALLAMKKGQAVAILADHRPAAAGNPWADFMGQPVRTGSLPFKLIKRFRPHVFFACARRVNGQVEAHFIPADEGLEQCDDEVSALTQINAGLAAMINLAPTQYQWTYKRFHRTPDGKRPLYKKELVALLKKLPADRQKLGLGAYDAQATQQLTKRLDR